MSLEALPLIRQYDFSAGFNYTDDPLHLSEKEMDQGENVYWEQGLKVIPGSARVFTATAFPGASPALVGSYQYQKAAGTKYFVGVSSNGTMAYTGASSWTVISTTLATTANTFWDWAVFNNALIATSGNNAVKTWDGTTFATLGGSPPQGKYVSSHGDYLLIAGYSSDPGQLRYSDTATAATWPTGNVVNIGLDGGHIITGLQQAGDVTYVLLDHSIYQLSGMTPTTFRSDRTLSDVGHVGGPTGFVLTRYGLFFWSEGGPALFNGVRSIMLAPRRLQRLLDTVDWSNTKGISAGFYPYKNQLFFSYPRTGQGGVPDRMLMLDLERSTLEEGGKGASWWPMTFGATTMAQAEDSLGRYRLYFGTSNGYACAYDSGTTYNAATIVGRARTRVYHLGRPDRTTSVRSVDLWVKNTQGNLVIRYAVDGATSLTTHTTASMYNATDTTSNYKKIKLDGDGAGARITNQLLQFEVLNATTGFQLYGIEAGEETQSRRRTT